MHEAATCQRAGKKGEVQGAYDKYPKPDKERLIGLLLRVGIDPQEPRFALEWAIELTKESEVLDGLHELERALSKVES